MGLSYDVLTAIVAINAIVTFSLWRLVATKVTRPAGVNKKAAKALWNSDPIVPRHEPPNFVGRDNPGWGDDAARTFFDDFKEFADVVNWWLADKYIATRFRLQNLPDLNVSLNVSTDGGPTVGRCFAIYYNQSRIGRLEVHPSILDYTTQAPCVYTSVRIDWARLLGYVEITEFLGMIASHVTNPDPKSDEYIAARQRIQYSLTETLWANYRISEFDRDFANEEDLDWGDLALNFYGTAEWYIIRRSAWQKNIATKTADAASAPKK